MFFSSYQTQNLSFAFSKYAFCLPNGIPNGHGVKFTVIAESVASSHNFDMPNDTIPSEQSNSGLKLPWPRTFRLSLFFPAKSLNLQLCRKVCPNDNLTMHLPRTI
jgi:hypothetical protein